MKEGQIKLTKNDIMNIINYGVIISNTDFRWTKSDAKLMLKLSLMLKDLNRQDYDKRKVIIKLHNTKKGDIKMEGKQQVVKMKVKKEKFYVVRNTINTALCPKCDRLIYRWKDGWRCPLHGYFEIDIISD